MRALILFIVQGDSEALSSALYFGHPRSRRQTNVCTLHLLRLIRPKDVHKTEQGELKAWASSVKNLGALHFGENFDMWCLASGVFMEDEKVMGGDWSG